MSTFEHPDTTSLLADYSSDLDGGRGARWWLTTTYTAPTDVGTLHVRPWAAEGEPGGPTTEYSTVWIETDDNISVRWKGDPQPDPDVLAEAIASLIERAQPDAGTVKDDLLARLRDLSAERARIDAAIRDLAPRAVAVGAQKITVAQAARVSRPTLDKWVAEQ